MRIPGFCNVRVLGLDWNCRVNVLEAILKLAVERERESLCIALQHGRSRTEIV